MNVGEIRQANQTYVSGICKIMSLVWPENTVNVARVEHVVNDSNHVTTVSVNEGEVVGFADGFLTTSADGTKRWELDLLAVQPNFQRRGIAAALVAANTLRGQLIGAEIARGLVAVNNVGSQRSFAKCGYATNAVVCELLIAFKAQPLKTELEHKLPFIQVHTLNYSGLWIEGERTQSHLESALAQLVDGQNDLVGMVVPTHEQQVIQDALSLGFERVGRYQWWQRPLM